jgi:hypothetical protein
MPNAYTHYVTWISRGRRHHGSASAEITPPPPPSVLTAGDTFQPTWAPPTLPGPASTTLYFAFWSVTGGTNGAYISTANTPPSATAGSSDITATAWYIPEGGTGTPGGPGVLIDAFDVSIGNFVDDDFVTVQPDDASHTLTAQANNDGFVPTTAAEDIQAYNSLPIEGVPFSTWNVFVGSESVTNRDLNPTVNSSAVAFAFYQAPASSGPVKPPHLSAAEWTWVSYGVMVDGGGPTGRGPVDPWNPYLRQLAAGLAMADVASKVDAKLRGDVLALAAKQVTLAAANISKQIQSFGG